MLPVYYPVAIVTLLTGILILGMAIAVARAHRATGIQAPQMTGDPRLERAVRAHLNTLEWLPAMLPAMWIFALTLSPLWAALIGLIWIAARIAYFAGYLSAPGRRYPGFMVQGLATIALILGALGRLVWLWLAA